MGYWEEKKGYEEEQAKLKFCKICGRKLNNKNIKGKCVGCGRIICNFCGKLSKGKIICSDCEKNKEIKKKYVRYIDGRGNVCEKEFSDKGGFFGNLFQEIFQNKKLKK